MTNRDIIADFETIHAKAYEIRDNHAKTCEDCINERICAVMRIIETITEEYDVFHYKYAHNDINVRKCVKSD